MTVLVIADDDGLLERLPEARADVLISCGDLPDYVIQRAAARALPRHILAVKGNHDGSAPFPTPIQNLHLGTVKIAGLTFGGFGGAWKYKPKGHHLFEQFEVSGALTNYAKVDVFVAHNSPRLVHDRDDGIHTGFVAFNDYLLRHKPRYLLHGHQHVNQESLVGSTKVIGTYGFRYMVIPE
jgi:Icc-related predicted phosphoesterase